MSLLSRNLVLIGISVRYQRILLSTEKLKDKHFAKDAQGDG